MPVLTLPKRRRKPRTPLEHAAELVHLANQPDGPSVEKIEAPRYIDPEDIASPDLLYQRERAYAICMGYRMDRWLLLYVANQRIPLDNCLRAIELLQVFVEASLLAKIAWPHLFDGDDQADENEPESALHAPRDEREAAEYGLTVDRAPCDHQRKSGRSLPPANLPGCHGTDPATRWSCTNLRRYGAKFCVKCEAKERERLRRMA